MGGGSLKRALLPGASDGRVHAVPLNVQQPRQLREWAFLLCREQVRDCDCTRELAKSPPCSLSLSLGLGGHR